MATIEQAIIEAEIEIKGSLRVMESYLEMGLVMYSGETLKIKVEYKEIIVFKTMNHLYFGNYKIPSDWDFISLEEKDKRLSKLINLLLK